MCSDKASKFRYELLIDNKNADKLFMAFLKKLEQSEIDPTDLFTINEIAEMIPRGTQGVSNYSTYGFSLMSMFSNQKGRDYFVFEEFALSKTFTEICNNADRNNYEWRKHYLDKTCRINPRYYGE